MLFNSTFFILIFFPIALLGWTFLKKLENQLYSRVFLTGMSFWFYGYYNINYLWILLASLVLNFIISLSFEKIRAKETGI
ncbi:MAG: MBOAT family protein, partial [Lachnospiraceae bacterium]|nr:MBOAT family protein [Lachnospiraceae bacterium]